MTGILIRRTWEDKNTERTLCKEEEAKEYLGLPEAERGKDSPLKTAEYSDNNFMLHFQSPEL